MQVAITTPDNPYDPLLNPIEWDTFDRAVGHHTNSLLDRVVRTSNELSDVEQVEAIEAGIDEIIKNDLANIYIKIKRE